MRPRTLKYTSDYSPLWNRRLKKKKTNRSLMHIDYVESFNSFHGSELLLLAPLRSCIPCSYLLQAGLMLLFLTLFRLHLTLGRLVLSGEDQSSEISYSGLDV